MTDRENLISDEIAKRDRAGEFRRGGMSVDIAFAQGARWGADNLAAKLDPEKVAEVLLRILREEAMLFDNGTEEWIAESDPVECLPPLASALCEAFEKGELT